MRPSRIPIDGLWRCLCPSIDISLASWSIPSLSPLRNTSVRPQVCHKRLPRPRTRFQPLHTSPRNSQLAEGLNDGVTPPSIRRQQSESEPSHIKLNLLPLGQLHDHLRDLTSEPNAYYKIANLVEYLVTFREKPSLIHYDALIRANADAQNGSAEVVRKLLQEMKDSHIGADSRLYHGVLQVLAVHPNYILQNKIMEEMKERWIGLSPEGWHYLVVGLLRDKQIESAMDMFEQMRIDQIKIQPWLYNIFLYQLCELGELDEAFRMFKEWWESFQWQQIDPTTYHRLLDAFSSGLHYEGTKLIWDNRVNGFHTIPSDGVCLSVLNIAARYADPVLATSAIRILSSRKGTLASYHYEALLEAYMNFQDLETSLRILTIMSRAGIEPDASSTRAIYLHLSQETQRPYEAWELLRAMHEAGQDIPVGAVNVIIEASVSHGNIEEAMAFYKQLHTICSSKPNTETFNVLLKGLSGKGMKETAMFLAAEMSALNVKPDRLTYDRFILLCLLENDLGDAFSYLDEMKKTGTSRGESWWMRLGTVSELVRRCTIKGDERAWDLLEEMEKRGISDSAAHKLKLWAQSNWAGIL